VTFQSSFSVFVALINLHYSSYIALVVFHYS